MPLILDILFLPLFLVPAVVLAWRIMVTKTRSEARKVGAAAAAMITVVGAFVVFSDLQNFEFKEWRADVALAAAAAASIYLLAWSMKRHCNRRHRTISIIAAIIGLVPITATVLTTLMYRE